MVDSRLSCLDVVCGLRVPVGASMGSFGDKVSLRFVDTPRHTLVSTNVLSPRQHFGTSNCLKAY